MPWSRPCGSPAPRSARFASIRATSRVLARRGAGAAGRSRRDRHQDHRVTNDLDEFAIAALRSAPLDSFGVGTAVVTGSGAPAAGLVYKLAAHLDDEGNWIPVGKRSAEKATVAGRKQPVRALRDGVAAAEHIYVEEPPSDGVGRELLVDLVIDGEPVAWASARTVCSRRASTTPRRSPSCRPNRSRSTRGEPAIPTYCATSSVPRRAARYFSLS